MSCISPIHSAQAEVANSARPAILMAHLPPPSALALQNQQRGCALWLAVVSAIRCASDGAHSTPHFARRILQPDRLARLPQQHQPHREAHKQGSGRQGGLHQINFAVGEIWFARGESTQKGRKRGMLSYNEIGFGLHRNEGKKQAWTIQLN